MKNGPARERNRKRSPSSYGRLGKVAFSYPSSWGPLRSDVVVELELARVVAFGSGNGWTTRGNASHGWLARQARREARGER